MAGAVGGTTETGDGARPVRLGPLKKWERPAAGAAGSVLAGAGVAAVFVSDNQAGSATLIVVGGLFLLYLAWNTFRARPGEAAVVEDRRGLRGAYLSILGLTLDYGPFGFMEAFDARHICNHTDQGGRYSYANQVPVGHWNCYALGNALLPLIGMASFPLARIEHSWSRSGSTRPLA